MDKDMEQTNKIDPYYWDNKSKMKKTHTHTNWWYRRIQWWLIGRIELVQAVRSEQIKQ